MEGRRKAPVRYTHIADIELLTKQHWNDPAWWSENWDRLCGSPIKMSYPPLLYERGNCRRCFTPLGIGHVCFDVQAYRFLAQADTTRKKALEELFS